MAWNPTPMLNAWSVGRPATIRTFLRQRKGRVAIDTERGVQQLTCEKVRGVSDQVDPRKHLNGVHAHGDLGAANVDLLETVHVR